MEKILISLYLLICFGCGSAIDLKSETSDSHSRSSAIQPKQEKKKCDEWRLIYALHPKQATSGYCKPTNEMQNPLAKGSTAKKNK